jgi:GAF domain-containing protein
MVFILCVPILKKSGEVIGILEMGRKAIEPKFSEDDEQTVKSYLSWATVAIDCSNIHYDNVLYHLLFDGYNKIIRHELWD